jgi:ribose-phosphate pyrophosphokinase
LRLAGYSSHSVSEQQPRDRLVIIGGRSHPAFVDAVCAALGHQVGRTRVRTFSDGAIEVKLDENVRGRDVFVVQSGQARPNDYVMELLFHRCARRTSARSVTAVLPYFRTGRRQKDEPRVSIRGRGSGRHPGGGSGACPDVDLRWADPGFFRARRQPVRHARCWLQSRGSGDEVGQSKAVIVARTRRPACARLRDTFRRRGHDRPGQQGARVPTSARGSVTALLGDVRDRDAILADDIVFTGGSLANMAHAVKDAGARSLRAIVSHGLFTGDAVERMRASPLQEVIVTDSVPLPEAALRETRIRQVSVAPLFAEAIRSIYEETSISRLFD